MSQKPFWWGCLNLPSQNHTQETKITRHSLLIAPHTETNMNDRLRSLKAFPSFGSETKNSFASQNPTNGTQPKKNKRRFRGMGLKKKKAPRVDEAQQQSFDREESRDMIMDKFFRIVESCKDDCEAVQKATKQIGKTNDRMLMATIADEEKEFSKMLRETVDDTNKRAQKAKDALELLKVETETFESQQRLNETDLRMRKNISTALTRKFVGEMKLYQAAQQKYKTDLKTKATRQIKVVKPDITEEEVDVILSDPDGRDGLIQQQLLVGKANHEVRITYERAHGKFQDILALETSLSELHQMFMDFALLVEQQGEILDDIEFHVTSATEDVGEGNEKIVDAIEYQKKIRKKQLVTILIGAVVVAVVLIIIL